MHNYGAKRGNYVRKRGCSFKLFHIYKQKNKSFQPQAVNFKAESELCGKLIGTSSILHAPVFLLLFEIWVEWYKTNPNETQDKWGIRIETTFFLEQLKVSLIIRLYFECHLQAWYMLENLLYEQLVTINVQYEFRNTFHPVKISVYVFLVCELQKLVIFFEKSNGKKRLIQMFWCNFANDIALETDSKIDLESAESSSKYRSRKKYTSCLKPYIFIYTHAKKCWIQVGLLNL